MKKGENVLISGSLGISYYTLYDWIKQGRKGNLHLEKRSDSNVSKLEEELQQLRKAAKEQAKEIKRLQEENEFLAEATAFFAAMYCIESSEVCKKERMKFIALKTNDGKERGKITFCCRVLEVTRQGFYDYLKNRDKPWKYESLAAEMMEIIYEDECNDTYGKVRMHEALMLKHPDGEGVPGESTVYRVMREIGIILNTN